MYCHSYSRQVIVIPNLEFVLRLISNPLPNIWSGGKSSKTQHKYFLPSTLAKFLVETTKEVLNFCQGNRKTMTIIYGESAENSENLFRVSIFKIL